MRITLEGICEVCWMISGFWPVGQLILVDDTLSFRLRGEKEMHLKNINLHLHDMSARTPSITRLLELQSMYLCLKYSSASPLWRMAKSEGIQLPRKKRVACGINSAGIVHVMLTESFEQSILISGWRKMCTNYLTINGKYTHLV